MYFMFYYLFLNRLASANFPHGHFSHVFIDEAGHAVEPESIIAIAGKNVWIMYKSFFLLLPSLTENDHSRNR